MNYDCYTGLVEWPYKNIAKRIYAEELIENDGKDLCDFKFFCFNGEVKFYKIDFGRFVDHHANYYDRNSKLLPFGEADFPPVPDRSLWIPDNIDTMISIAEKLSEGHSFLRVDLYNVKGKILFGELTFYPASGYGKFTSKEWDNILGSWIELPKEKHYIK